MISIVSDTSTLYSISEGKEIGLSIVPLNITVDDKSYKDFEDITDHQLLKMIEENKVPRTSQPSLGEKIDIYNELLKKGEVIVVVGPSGCGKSTLLKSLNRMNDLVEGCTITGKVELDGEDIYGDMDVNLLRKRVGMVFQKPNPFPMSIYDNVAYGPRTHGIRSKAKLDEIVEKSLRDAAIWDEVKDRLHKNALGLSGGQQQRVAIARAIATRPSLFLADEPTGNLDSKSGKVVADEFQKINEKMGKTILMVTHDPQMASRCRRVIFLKDGLVLNDVRKDGTEEEFYRTIIGEMEKF